VGALEDTGEVAESCEAATKVRRQGGADDSADVLRAPAAPNKSTSTCRFAHLTIAAGDRWTLAKLHRGSLSIRSTS